MFKYLLLLFLSINLYSQEDESIDKSIIDSLYIVEVEKKNEVEKVLHAEPLFIDLIRDLGARKGEKEWNFGMSMTDDAEYDRYEGLIEYEWAPIDRLGLEIEIPFTFYYPHNGNGNGDLPGSRINSLKLAGQWSFYVNTNIATSMAIGMIHEFEFNEFKSLNQRVYIGNLYNPFFVAAKRWGDNFHTLLYTGPRITQHFDEKVDYGFEINSNFHYMIPGTRNFIGLEVNQEYTYGEFSTTFRPQMRVGINEHLLIGIVTGIPVGNSPERLSTFLRVIWEPPH
jgi:hypothetical protein